jgi:hypothetical protein
MNDLEPRSRALSLVEHAALICEVNNAIVMTCLRHGGIPRRLSYDEFFSQNQHIKLKIHSFVGMDYEPETSLGFGSIQYWLCRYVLPQIAQVSLSLNAPPLSILLVSRYRHTSASWVGIFFESCLTGQELDKMHQDFDAFLIKRMMISANYWKERELIFNDTDGFSIGNIAAPLAGHPRARR